MDDRTPYLIEAGSLTWDKVQKIIDDYKAAAQARLDVSKKYGAKGVFGNRTAIVGLLFGAVEIPDGFRRDCRDPNGVFRPDRKSTAGLAIAKEMKIALPGYFEITRMFGYGGLVRDGHIHYLSIEEFDGQRVLLVPNGDNGEPSWTPPLDCTRMKLSDFYALKEQHGTIKKGTA